ALGHIRSEAGTVRQRYRRPGQRAFAAGIPQALRGTKDHLTFVPGFMASKVVHGFVVSGQWSVVSCLIPHSAFRSRSMALDNDEIRMTNVERMSKHECPRSRSEERRVGKECKSE